MAKLEYTHQMHINHCFKDKNNISHLQGVQKHHTLINGHVHM